MEGSRSVRVPPWGGIWRGPPCSTFGVLAAVGGSFGHRFVDRQPGRGERPGGLTSARASSGGSDVRPQDGGGVGVPLRTDLSSLGIMFAR